MDSACFKGVSEGVFLDVKGKNLDNIKKDLEDKLKTTSNFFQGAKFLGVRSDELNPVEILDIKLMLKYKYDFNISTDNLTENIKNFNISNLEQDNAKTASDGVVEGMTKFVYGTLRSGQEVDYEGNIVVVGDVNPGAFLKAKGNIVVLGSLRGVAHAGVGGNINAIVAAYSLLPTQLRIAENIVRPPEGDIQYKLPEIAKIINGEVFIEPYLPNK